MTCRTSLPYARGSKRPTCDYHKVMEELGCSKNHVYNLFQRGELQGFFAGAGRGLRIYLDTVENLKSRNAEIHLL